MFFPGSARDRIEVFNLSTEKTESSARIRTYTHAFFDRAEYSFVRGAEAMTGQMSAPERTINLKVGWHPSSYHETQILKFQGDMYNIRAINPDRDRSYLIITADRMQAGTYKLAE
ncbi:MAG: hypothetical protein A2W90_02570 [Bacteroidetes bacterium GWF2_42_66]|nr:MAG: hypothetical protein A2W92_19620 [Bacteroidetes bacterium GWA2_42_15]OFY01235.1 MAG: hypothetical protein A2W89_16055 [Bacteroidetes bacterium GWE2_42_39]OFY42078.1 MAG: hypothetical protein A2W90_02570 [Bacteroidetes bacterium GWF2_42_66]HBL77719.1 hypothetical protein [Prolixibacteraceae bacterium]HCB62848.1 hypothetical protein [Bacteroidales bacterium]